MDITFVLLTSGKLLAVLFLVLMNGFFVAAEFSIVAIRRSRVEELVAKGQTGALPLQNAVKHLDLYLATTQLGVTMASLALGWIGEPALAVLIESALHFLPAPIALIGSHALAVAIAFALITALHIVLGELAPKSLALQRTEKTALTIAWPLEIYLTIFKPAIYLLNKMGNLVLHLFGIEASTSEVSVYSVEELKLLVADSHKAGLLSGTEKELLGRVFRLGRRRVGALMKPRTEIVWLNLSSATEEVQAVITQSPHTHLPVAHGSLDNLLGILDVKNFWQQHHSAEALNIKKCLQRPLFVPESMVALKLLETFKRSGTPLAFVIDEYGEIQGLVNLDDILGAIVGDLQMSEPTVETHNAIQRPDGSWVLDGLFPIDEFKEKLHLRKLPHEGKYQTLGGFIMMQMGHIPAVGERCEWQGLSFEICNMAKHRIDRVIVKHI